MLKKSPCVYGLMTKKSMRLTVGLSLGWQIRVTSDDPSSYEYVEDDFLYVVDDDDHLGQPEKNGRVVRL